MLTQKTVAEIWTTHEEIKNARHLFNLIVEEGEKGRKKGKATLQIGIPNGEQSHRMFDVEWSVVSAVLDQHLTAKTLQLETLNEQAKAEIV